MGNIAASIVALLLMVQPLSAAERCGSDRWAVKTLTDLDSDRVSLNPIATSIHSLAAIPIHEVPYPPNRRLPPEELRTYTVRGQLVARLLETDKDLHIVLADPDVPSATLIAEIPSGGCAARSPLVDKFDVVRATVLNVPIDSVIVVTGVGFFDFLHNARGQAPNGFELHPVFQVEPERATERRQQLNVFVSAPRRFRTPRRSRKER
jgi:hypothetical protein